MGRQKRKLGLLLVMVMVLCLAACGKDSTNTTTNTTSPVNEEAQKGEVSPEGEATQEVIEKGEEVQEETKQEDKTETSEQVETTEATTEPDSIIVPEFTIATKEYEMNDALQFVQDMQVGWNLGNTLDANSDTNSSNELSYETSWCGVKTTQEMITAIKDAGFKTIRIPVSWHNHVSGDDFIISDIWMDRVQEIVDYAYNIGMYVILNIHHDTMVGYYYPNTENYDTSARFIESIWNQISDRFADYDEHLIFEAINEPRLKGTNYEWWLDMGNDQCKDAVDCINRLNQLFVDTVRAKGGINATRYLMVPGYCASPEFALIDQFVLPTDLTSNENRIIVSVHAYTPYNFALQAPTEGQSTSVFSIANKVGTGDIDSFMERLYKKFISNGTAIVIGEFGARDKDGNLQARTEYAAYYVAAARARGMSCIWWDNNAYTGSGENFGLFNRKSLTFAYPDIESALITYSK